ncbi:MAG TPA: VOC family protein [Terriglobia bacterium]|nr:VOC family protein [Terriglobia bacterium]
MTKLSTHLWFDKEAREAAKFYTSVFGSSNGSASKVKDTTTLTDTPSGSVDVVTIELAGQEFSLLSAGPLFKFNPSVSFLVACKTKDEVDSYWEKLSKGGSALMALGAYPFSERYGWTQDKYGLSWQVMFAGGRPIHQKITPMLMFVGEVSGKAEEAIRFYASVFHDSKIGDFMRHGRGEGPDKEGTVKFGPFTLDGHEFAAMDSAHPHKFKFNEAISFMVHCDTQKEIDYYWEKLSAVRAAEQCGWLKDRYGLSWQIVPTIMQSMFKEKNQKKLAKVTEAFLKMKKFDIEALRQAYEK